MSMLQPLVEELTLLQERWALTNDWMDRVCHVSFNTLLKVGNKTVADEATIAANPEQVLRDHVDVRDLDLRGPMAFASIGRKLARWLGSAESEIEWLSKPSDSFGGLPPIEVCASSLENVQWVAYTLDTHLIAQAKQTEKDETKDAELP